MAPREGLAEDPQDAWRRAAAQGDPATVAFYKDAAVIGVTGIDTQGAPLPDRTLRYIITSDRPDRYGDTVVQEGMDTTFYHDVVLYGHHYGGWETPPLPPIGKNIGFERAQLTDGTGTTVTRATVTFAGIAQNHELAETSYLLARDGFMPDCSIGFRPKRGAWTFDEKSGAYIFKEWHLLEWSVVPIGANTDAVRLSAHAREKGIDLRPIEEWVERSLSTLAALRGTGERDRLEKAALAIGKAVTILDLKPKGGVTLVAPAGEEFFSVDGARQALHERRSGAQFVVTAPEGAAFQLSVGSETGSRVTDKPAEEVKAQAPEELPAAPVDPGDPAAPIEAPIADEPTEDCPACAASGKCSTCNGTGQVAAPEEAKPEEEPMVVDSATALPAGDASKGAPAPEVGGAVDLLFMLAADEPEPAPPPEPTFLFAFEPSEVAALVADALSPTRQILEAAAARR